jgi:putative component of membrane protein insertase Oxa1/YidC/SpoIIIJ protein YidD
MSKNTRVQLLHLVQDKRTGDHGSGLGSQNSFSKVHRCGAFFTGGGNFLIAKPTFRADK